MSVTERPPAPLLPPLLEGRPAPRGGTVLERAARAAAAGEAGAGTLLWRHDAGRWSVALVLEPEVGPARAAAMLPLAQLALAEALAMLAPAGTQVALRWTGEVLVNGAACGRAEGVMAATTDGRRTEGRRAEGRRAEERRATEGGGVPAWLAVALVVPLAGSGEPGHDPGRTTLHEEIGPVDPVEMTETVGRHWLAWLNRWEEEGLAPVARAWGAMAADLGAPVEAGGRRGRFLGLDDEGGALLATDEGTAALPLLDLWRRA